ncbi:ribosomal 50S subunit-recycling heat shock protein [Rhizobium tibeticum]|uniref:DUF5839 family protein n=1 Tax=Rhizobium tibeticum TaxID=501024 RepID=UPI00278B38A2|nr:DUF5839 family protein [Rhizobium tibeticum]MDP9809401.1 ribosomal 50S subunit-recycling heat shock protein [Rhizobium tibeticum]
MTDLLTPARAVAAIKFKWQKDEKTYDYFVPNGLEVAAGDKVVVATSRGETEVTVVEIKAESNKAEKDILRRVEAPAASETARSDEWNF